MFIYNNLHLLGTLEFFPFFCAEFLLLGLEHRLGDSGGVTPFPLLPDSNKGFTKDLLLWVPSSLKIFALIKIPG